MKASSTQPSPTQPQRWKEGQSVVYFNHTKEPSEDGIIYSAEFSIIKSMDDLEGALLRHFCDPVFEQKVIDNIEVNGKPAIDIIKTYKPALEIVNKVSEILKEHK